MLDTFLNWLPCLKCIAIGCSVIFVSVWFCLRQHQTAKGYLATVEELYAETLRRGELLAAWTKQREPRIQRLEAQSAKQN
jgi:hypothetical protein